MQNITQNNAEKFLYKQESFLIRGICFDLYKKFRNAYKEIVYHNALIQELRQKDFSIEKNKQIPIIYNGKKLGVYVPDIIVDNKILIELKSKPFLTKDDYNQFWQYLKGSSYKVGFLINFGNANGVEIVRRIYDTARVSAEPRKTFEPRKDAEKSVSRSSAKGSALFGDKLGQTLVELLLALGIFAFIMTAIFALVFGGLTTGLRTEEQDYATMYAQEGLDAARSIRDTDWGSFVSANDAPNTHGVTNTGTGWSWSGTNNETTYGARKFTREISVEDVYRTASGDIFTGSNSVNFDYSNSGDYQCEGGTCPSANLIVADSTAKLIGSIRLDNSVNPKELTPYITANTKALYHFNKSEGDEFDIGSVGNLSDDDLGGASESNLKGLWHMNEGSGISAADSSSSGNGGFYSPFPNNTFETVNSGWGAGSENLTFNNTRSKNGAYSGRIVKTTVGELVQFSSGNSNNNAGHALPSSATQYQYGGCVYISGNVSADIFFFSWASSGGNRYDGTYDAISTSTQNQWTCISGTTTNVASGNNLFAIRLDNNGGNPGGTVWFDDIWVRPVNPAAGKFSNALSFDGVDDRVEVPDSASLDLNQNTAEAWIYPTVAPAAWAQIASKEVSPWGAPFYAYGLSFNDTGRVRYCYSEGVHRCINGTTVIPLNQWMHVAGTYDGSTVRLYVNGIQENSAAFSATLVNTTGPFGIGSSAGGNRFTGLIDEAAVYNAVLAGTTIKEHYERGVAKDAEKNGGGQNWQYQRAITITGSTSGALYNYQIPITLTTTEMGNPYTNVKTDCSDIRFTNSSGDELSYWIESCNTSGSSKIWVKADSIPASPSTATIYMYYGNTAATSASRGDNVFEFFDDFSGTAINTAKWAETDTGSNISQNNEIVIANGTGAWGPTALFSQSNFSRGNKEFQYKFRPTCTTGATYTVTTMLGWKDTGAGTSYVDMPHAFYWVRTTAANSESFQVYEDGTGRGDVAAGAPDFVCGTQYWGKVALKATGADYYTSTDGTSWTLRYTGTYSSETPLKVGVTNYQGGTSYFDDAFIKQYASAEPAVAAPGAATAGTYNLNLKGDFGTILGPISATGNTGLKEALSFNDGDDMVLLSSPVDLPTTSWTIEAWFQYPLASMTGWNTLTRGNAGDHQIIVRRSDMQLGMYDNVGGTGFQGSGYFINTLSNGWHHIATVGTGGQQTFYIDGQAVGTPVNKQSTSDIYAIGNYQGGGQTWGLIDEVAIWDKALTQADIWDHIGANLGYTTNSYATVKRSANFPATDYIDRFKEFVETATIPAGTSIDYQLSTNNCTTMKYWDGDSWEAAGGWNDARTITRYLNFLTPSSTICLSARLNTTDTNQTPVLDNVEIKYSQNKDNGITWPADTHTKKVTSRVKWPSGFSFQDISLTEYLTDWSYGFWTQTTYDDFSTGSTIIPAGRIDIKDSASPNDANLGLMTTLFSSWTQTNDTTTSYGFNFTGNGDPAVGKALSSTVVSGIDNGASVNLSPGTAPYITSGTYTSGVLNVGQQSDFIAASWTATTTGADTFTHTSNGDFSGTHASTMVSGGSVKLSLLVTGDGSDGAITLSSSGSLSTSDFSTADGDSTPDGQITTLSSAASAGATQLTVASISGFYIGDEILVHQTYDNSANNNEGRYEFARITGVGGSNGCPSGNYLCLRSSLTNSYYTSSASAQIIRVPQYTNVTINSGIGLSANQWNGSSGGIVVFRASGTVQVNGSISAGTYGLSNQIGMSGGNYGTTGTAYQGNSYKGTSAKNIAQNNGGGGGGDGNIPSSCSINSGAGGGGGGYGGNGTTGGAGSYIAGTAGTGGFGLADLTKLYLGPGGGGGGSGSGGAPCVIGPGTIGGRGGGGIMIFTNNITVTGTILADGETGKGAFSQLNNPRGGGSGGGAGGSIFIKTIQPPNLGSNLVTARGGAGGVSEWSNSGGAGGGGGAGRIRVEQANAVPSVTTNPAASTASYGYINELSGAYTSLIKEVGSGTKFGTMSWAETLNGLLPANTPVKIKARSCDDAACNSAVGYSELAFSSITATACTGGSANGCTIDNGGNLTSLSSVTNGHGWVQYEVTLSTTNTAVTPTLDSVIINTVPLVLEMRAGITAMPEDCPPTCTNWTAWTEIGSGATQSDINLDAFDGKQYIQYRAKFSTVNTAYSPSLDEIVINYSPNVETSYSFISKELDTNAPHRFLVISWNENTPLGTSINFQAATAQDNGSGSPGIWTSFMGPAGTGASGDAFSSSASGCSKIVAAVTCLIPSTIAIGDGNNDQWIKYKTIFTSNGENPTLNDVNLMYRGGY